MNPAKALLHVVIACTICSIPALAEAQDLAKFKERIDIHREALVKMTGEVRDVQEQAHAMGVSDPSSETAILEAMQYMSKVVETLSIYSLPFMKGGLSDAKLVEVRLYVNKAIELKRERVLPIAVQNYITSIDDLVTSIEADSIVNKKPHQN